jgi:dynein assembly factor 1
VIENISFNTKLDSLYLKSNRIGRGGLADMIGLLECPSLVCLDIQSNNISDVEILDEVLAKMPKLKVLYMQGNEITKKIPSYRKTVISKIPTLMYLDDRPVFVEDRRHAEAYTRGGIEAEREERNIIKKEKDEAHQKNHEAFKEMMRKAREEKRKDDEAKALAAAKLKE